MAINFNKAEFTASYGTVEQLPRSIKPEVAFAGRSNAGKSSILNKLLGRKSLAQVSKNAGKTVNINFYDVGSIYLVDLPGYGFAKVSHKEKDRWMNLIEGYFQQRRKLCLVVILVDIRLDASPLDINMVEFLTELEIPFVIALTKADKLSKSKQSEQLQKLKQQYGLESDQFIITSATTGQGVDDLRNLVAKACGK